MPKDFNFSQYSQEITRMYHKLSAKEERSLGRRIKKGDEEAVMVLVKANLPFVVYFARRYNSPGMTLSDLIQEGNVGLVEAARAFNYRRGVRFSTFASWKILQHIRRSIEMKSGVMRLPSNFYYEHRKLKQEYEEAKAKGKPFRGKVPKYIGKNGEYYPEKYDLKSVPLENVYTLKQTDDVVLGEMENRDEIEKLMSVLDEEQCMLIEYSYGLNGRPQLSSKEIGALLGVSQRKVTNRVTRALWAMWSDWSKTTKTPATSMPNFLNTRRFRPKN